MPKTITLSVMAFVMSVGLASHANVASGMPVTGGLATNSSAPSDLEVVRSRGGGRGGGWRGGRGWGVGGGIVAGAILGGMLAAPYYYPGPAYYYGPRPDDAVAYCMQRFRSYDPGSGTYLGYDGFRHPCP